VTGAVFAGERLHHGEGQLAEKMLADQPLLQHMRIEMVQRGCVIGVPHQNDASLGELYAVLSNQGIRVPNGFALTAQSYRQALAAAGAWDRLRQLLGAVDKTHIDVLAKRAAEARAIVFDATGTDRLRRDITESYQQLEREYGTNVAVAVRSSATAWRVPDLLERRIEQAVETDPRDEEPQDVRWIVMMKGWGCRTGARPCLRSHIRSPNWKA
jgi:Pyruvate phosphate dikinase, AMP/ATP-binding domain